MLKVFTGVFVVQSAVSTFDVVEQALKRQGSNAEADLGRHVVELHVKVEAPAGQTGEKA